MKKLAIGFGVLVFLIGILIFRPVPIVAEDRAVVVEGTVDTVYGFGAGDIVFRLKNHSTRYYINRGEERGLAIDNLSRTLIGQPVVIKYPKYWTPLDWNNTVRHLSKLEHNGHVLFNELK